MQDHVLTSTSDQDPSIYGVTENRTGTDATISPFCVTREFPGAAEQQAQITELANTEKTHLLQPSIKGLQFVLKQNVGFV